MKPIVEIELEIQQAISLDPKGKYLLIAEESLPEAERLRLIKQINHWLSEPSQPVAVINPGLRLMKMDSVPVTGVRAMSDLILFVQHCASCGASHHIEFKELDYPDAGWTHVGNCPNTDRPVLVRIQQTANDPTDTRTQPQPVQLGPSELKEGSNHGS